VHLARLDRDVDVIVGYQVAEALGDAAQFESQRILPESGPGRREDGNKFPEQSRRPAAGFFPGAARRLRNA
jgi:hypothetical protein